MPSTKKNEAAGGLTITDQFRSRTGLVYDLKCGETRITVSITQGAEGDESAAAWTVEARATSSPDSAAAVGRGATARDALREVGRTWESRASAREVPVVDWDAVAFVLADVRAL